MVASKAKKYGNGKLFLRVTSRRRKKYLAFLQISNKHRKYYGHFKQWKGPKTRHIVYMQSFQNNNGAVCLVSAPPV